MKTRAFPLAAAVWLAAATIPMIGCERPGEPEAVEAERDAQGKTHIRVDGDQVERNLEQAGENLEQAADQVQEGAQEVGDALERGAERVEAEVGPVVRDVLDDATITAKVKATLLADPEVKALQIDVDTIDGRVTLNGKVASNDQRMEAEKLASRTQGVREVVNLIQVAGQPAPPAPGTSR